MVEAATKHWYFIYETYVYRKKNCKFSVQVDFLLG